MKSIRFIFIISLLLVQSLIFAQVNKTPKDTLKDDDDNNEIIVLPENAVSTQENNNKQITADTSKPKVKIETLKDKDSIHIISTNKPEYNITESKYDNDGYKAIFVNGKIKWVKMGDSLNTANKTIITDKKHGIEKANKNTLQNGNKTDTSKSSTTNKSASKKPTDHYKAIIVNGKVKWVKVIEKENISKPVEAKASKKEKQVENSVEQPGLGEKTEAKPETVSEPFKKVEPVLSPVEKTEPIKKEETAQPKTISDTAKPIYIGGAIYRIQVSSTAKKNREEYVRESCSINEEIIVSFEKNAYKYMIGKFDSLKEAGEYIENFKKNGGCEDSFIVAYYQGKRITKEEALQINGK
ncbi:MAG: hypothetical protein Q8880_06250 [Bacteroidota bacterium]|nr:hypothetical protein [Bacteroidota bacterium]